MAPTPAPNAALADSDYELQKSFTGVAQNGFGDLSTTIPRLEGSAQAIKEQLQAYISNKFDERCSDFSSFEKQGFSITKNDKKVEVLIAENDVKVSMKMPVEIADVSTNSLAKIDAFETSVPVKLKQIQRIVSEFIQFDKKDISYEIKNRGDFLVTKSGPINGALGRYRVVSVIDSNSNIDGKAYRFQFAVKNRPPALNYLNKVCIQKNPGDSISLDDVMNEIIPDDTLCTTTPPAAALSGMNCLQGGGDRSKQKAWDPDEDDNDGLVFELKLLRPAPDNTEENWPVPPGDEMPDVGSLRGRIKVSDGESSDYQNIEIRNPSVATC
ncbi:hypothetical protein HYX09_02190 [Candidatus Woesearchaeota archaeon]|nr:hypothetical protein [Candidatus Woesearchaeota archaeon]